MWYIKPLYANKTGLFDSVCTITRLLPGGQTEMNHFQYKGNELYAEDVAIKDIVAKVGSPVYVYSHATLQRHFKAFDESFSGVPHTICYSVKANSTQSVLKTFVNMGGGVDIVSGGELYRALKAGVDPKKVVYSGVGKKNDEIEYALNSGILMFNVESEQELTRINEIAVRLGKKAGIAIRVNPVVDSIEKLKIMIGKLREMGITLQYFDCGGGLGIQYNEEEPPLPADYGKEIVAATKGLGMHLVFEPGRNIVGNAGILVATCLYTKARDEKNFIMIDAGMNDLARPALYGSYHGVQPVAKDQDGMIVADIVGPICESGDFLAKDREVPMFKQGDLMAFMSAGAYGFAMSSSDNSRPRVAEVMVKWDRFEVVREGETIEDLIKGEKIASFL